MARKQKITENNVTASWNKEPQSEAEYICMGNELVAWAQQDDSLTIDGFPISKMIAPSIFHALSAKSEQFAQSYDIALGIIGSRRERLAHEGLLSTQIVRATMPLYDPVYRKWILSQKAGEEEVGQTKVITVGIPTYLSCPDGSHKSEMEKYMEKEKRDVNEAKLLSKAVATNIDW